VCSTQNIYLTRDKVGKVLGIPVDKISIQYYEGSEIIRHSCHDDAAKQPLFCRKRLETGPGKFMRWTNTVGTTMAPLISLRSALESMSMAISWRMSTTGPSISGED